MKKLTREWVQKAEGDYVQATQNYRSAHPVYDGVCFHCQQCAEKYLKALLQELGLPIFHTHDLEALRVQLLPHHPSLRSFRRGLEFLTDFAVDVRYPGKKARKRQATAALRWAGRVPTEARTLLGIRPPRPRRKKPP
jgi:HEPN domain-containing protein